MAISPTPSIFSTRSRALYQLGPFSGSDPTLQAQSKQRRKLNFNKLKQNTKKIFGTTPKPATFADITPTEIEQLIPFLVENLQRAPTKGQRERLLKKLPERLLAGKWHSDTNGRTLCSDHSKLSKEVLHGLDSALRRVAGGPPPPLHLTDNRYFDAFFAMEAVWSEDIEEICGETVVECRLYQENECSGCRARRILSDGVLLDALLVAGGVSAMVSEMLGMWLEKAWEKLMLEVPEQVGYRGSQRRRERGQEVEMLKKQLEMMKWEETDSGNDL